MRIIFCADVKYPHGVAGANRVQYIAKALQNCGHNIVVLATDSTRDENDTPVLRNDDGVDYTTLPIRKGGLGRIVDTKLAAGKHAVNWLKGNGLSKDDIIYIYASSCLYVLPILKYVNKTGLKAIIDVVEWHQPYQYRLGLLNYRYQSVNRTFEKLTHKFHNVVAISELLKSHFDNQGCNTLLLPMIIDTQTVHSYADVNSKKDAINLIYQGNPCREDFVSMLKAMVFLKEKGESMFVFHTTGVQQSDVRKQLGASACLIDQLAENIVFHGWMEYQDLLALFKQMDFLFMSRYDDLVRKANFPSKLPECMARGIVPICNRVGDYWKYLSEKDSILFDESNVENCVDALRRAMALSKDELSQMKKNAIQCAQTNFDYRVWAEKLDSFIKQL